MTTNIHGSQIIQLSLPMPRSDHSVRVCTRIYAGPPERAIGHLEHAHHMSQIARAMSVRRCAFFRTGRRDARRTGSEIITVTRTLAPLMVSFRVCLCVYYVRALPSRGGKVAVRSDFPAHLRHPS